MNLRKKNYNIRRYKLLKSNKDRLVVRLSNRSCTLQVVSAGYDLKGDRIKSTFLFHKVMGKINCNAHTIGLFLDKCLPTIKELPDTILDIGRRHKSRGSKLDKVINGYRLHTRNGNNTI